MVLLNDKPVKFTNFPDGTLSVELSAYEMHKDTTISNSIEWHYENDAEFMLVAFLKMHFDNNPLTREAKSVLYLPYVPNARLDRVKFDTEVFTLKHFAKLINSLHFDKVVILDPHSNVTSALIDNVVVVPANICIDKAIRQALNWENNKLSFDDFVLFFPDEGSQKRYKTDNLTDYVAFFGNKIREWKGGKILGLNVETHTDKGLDYLKDKTVLIIDDIISAGGTVYHSIQKLKTLGVKSVYAYCTHLENTMFTQEQNQLRDLLEAGDVFKGIITTDSIYNRKDKNVFVIPCNRVM